MRLFRFYQLAIALFFLCSCGNNKNQEQKNIKPYNPNGYYGVSTTTYKCSNCGLIISQSDITHNCRQRRTTNGEYSNSGGNQYGAGYEQGQEDARKGLSPNPSGYGGNGQFEKGYEDGYND